MNLTEHIQVRFMKCQEEAVHLCSCANTDNSVLRLWRGDVFKVPQVLTLFPYTIKVSYIIVVSIGEDMGRRFFCVLDHLLGPTHHPR